MAHNLQEPKPKDHWSSQAYSEVASFVPQLTQTVLRYLEPKSPDRILDVGCGDGKFTANFAPSVEHVLGIDASPSMIESASKDFAGRKTEFKVVDCRYLDKETEIVNGRWDKVISNAALHWILRDPSTRLSTLKAIYSALKPGGTFVFEMGGAGNVAEVHAALLSALVHQGQTINQAREACPWFFPSDVWMRNALETIGFGVEKLGVEYRPTKLTTGEKGGMEGWVRFMGGSMLETLDGKTKREKAVTEVCESLKTVCTRDEDGSEWLGYVRLRGVARKSKSAD